MLDPVRKPVVHLAVAGRTLLQNCTSPAEVHSPLHSGHPGSAAAADQGESPGTRPLLRRLRTGQAASTAQETPQSEVRMRLAQVRRAADRRCSRYPPLDACADYALTQRD